MFAVLLTCSHYDSAPGRDMIIVARIMRAGRKEERNQSEQERK